MNPHRFFIRILLATLLCVAALYALAWWLQPVYGDLARIGGHAEREFGWNAPMFEFSPLEASWGGDRYTRPVEVLVLGDSFANLRPPMQWQNWLAALTGWRIHTLDKHHVDIDRLVESPLYRDRPPRVVIWNTIERDLRDEYADNDGHCPPHVAPTARDALPVRPTGARPRVFMRPSGGDGINPGYARAWLWKNLLRDHADLYTGDTRQFRLKRSDLFSSQDATGLLVYRHDLLKRTWREADLDRTRCSFASLAARFERNGVTRFVTALAPDKSSAYRPWLVEPAQLPESRLPTLMRGFPVADARLDLAVAEAIRLGMKDVYMPDDTHWGSAGHELAAHAILKLLVDLGLAR